MLCCQGRWGLGGGRVGGTRRVFMPSPQSPPPRPQLPGGEERTRVRHLFGKQAGCDDEPASDKKKKSSTSHENNKEQNTFLLF